MKLVTRMRRLIDREMRDNGKFLTYLMNLRQTINASGSEGSKVYNTLTDQINNLNQKRNDLKQSMTEFKNLAKQHTHTRSSHRN